MRKGNRGKFGRKGQQKNAMWASARSATSPERAVVVAKVDSMQEEIAEAFARAFKTGVMVDDVDAMEVAASIYESMTGKSILEWVSTVEAVDGETLEGRPFFVASASRSVKATIWLLAKARSEKHCTAGEFSQELMLHFEGVDPNSGFGRYCKDVIAASATPRGIEDARANLEMLASLNVPPKARAFIERLNYGYLAEVEREDLEQSLACIALPVSRDACRL